MKFNEALYKCGCKVPAGVYKAYCACLNADLGAGRGGVSVLGKVDRAGNNVYVLFS